MAQNRVLIGILLGLVSAVVILSTATGPVFMRFVLFIITSLPIFLAGLGWGAVAGLAAALTGTLVVGLLGWKAALIFGASQAAPAVVLAYLALLNRETPADAGRTPVIEWYPAGRLVVWAAAMAGIPAALWLFFFGGDAEGLKAAVGPHISELIKAQMPPETQPGPADLDRIVTVVVSLLPAASAIAWMLALVVNLWLAGRIVTASGNFIRPWPDLSAITYPAATPIALAVATAASFIDGWPGLVASGFSATLLLAYVLLGLAVIHFISRGTPWRPFLLWALYGSLLFVNAPLALPLAMLGLAETLFHFRARAVARTRNPDP